jgi:methyl-accepting chemotaxis protein
MDSSFKNETRISFFRSMRGKLILLFLVVALIPLSIAGIVAFIQLNKAKTAIDDFDRRDLPEIIELHNAQKALWHMVEAQKNHIIASDEAVKAKLEQTIEEKQQTLTAILDELRDDLDPGAETEAFEALESSLATFLELNEQILLLSQDGDHEAAQALSIGEAQNTLEEVTALIEEIDETNVVKARETEQIAHEAAQNGISLMLVVTVIAVIIVAIVAFFVANSLTKPLIAVAEIAQKLALGDVDQTLQIKKRDEIGLVVAAFNRMIGYQQEMAAAANLLAQGDMSAQVVPQSDKDRLGQAFSQMIAYQQQMAEVADRLAQGDLTANVSPQAEKDILGHAFSVMIINLRSLVSQIVETANTVGGASGQLAKTADQAGQASQQVTNTIQQVAAGTSQQTQAVAEVTGNVEQMARAANGIAKGAQEQAQSVLKTSSLVDQMSHLVEQVGQVARSSSQANTKVTQVARQGVIKVEQTTQGMEIIRTRSITTSDKIREMSSRSKEISRIVEAIDDIADKTDMLALNAAVEAARAGEYGRGFAVVAEQVRKLSEDAKSATRDIASLIERVQESVQETMGAMEGTLNEVINGTRLAGDTSKSLEEILQATEEATTMAEQIGEAVTQLRQKSQNVVAAIETVGTVVEENTASAEEMAANSEEVMQIIEGVATVAEENSASAEEVSASAEEMSAQIEEVVSSSLELASLAEQLRMAVSQFRIEEANSVQAGQTARNMAPVYTMTGPQGPRFMPATYQGNGEHRPGANPWKNN